MSIPVNIKFKILFAFSREISMNFVSLKLNRILMKENAFKKLKTEQGFDIEKL